AATIAGVRAAEAAVSSAQAGLEAARSGIDSARAGIQSAAAAVARIERDIDNLSVMAPFDGLLESDSAELGALLQAGSRCATILQIDPIKIVGFAPETEIAQIEVGARAGARLTGGETITGRVTFVSRNADPATRTFRVEITVPNGALAISAGQTAEIAVTAESRAAHLIPQSALTLADSGALGVRIVAEDQTALFVPVEVLRDTTDGIYVTGLPDEADVITVGQEYVTDGVPVIPSFEEVVQ
ncbi:efflux RND transporter periplasmic adaptor subunit, partial [Litorisediminicola beolgyonensis]